MFNEDNNNALALYTCTDEIKVKYPFIAVLCSNGDAEENFSSFIFGRYWLYFKVISYILDMRLNMVMRP